MNSVRKMEAKAIVLASVYIDRRNPDESSELSQANTREALRDIESILGQSALAFSSRDDDYLSQGLEFAIRYIAQWGEAEQDADDDVRALEGIAYCVKRACVEVDEFKSAADALATSEEKGQNRPDWIAVYRKWTQCVGLEDPGE